MDDVKLSDAAEAALQILLAEFSCELANQGISSEHVKYANLRDANMAMLREAYRVGAQSIAPAPTFSEDQQRVFDTNEVSRAAQRTYKGIPITKLSHEELLVAANWAWALLDKWSAKAR